MTTAAIDLDALLPTADDIASYDEHGFWISPVVLPDDVLDAAARGMARFHDGDRDHAYPGAPALADDGWNGGDGLRKNDYTSQQVDELAGLVRHPAIGAIAARLAAAEGIRLWHDQLLWKPTEADGAPTANVGWHTDLQYWSTCSSDAMLTAWVPLHDVDETTGSITFLDGSHRWQVDGLDFWNSDLGALTGQLEAAGHDVHVVPARLRRGQVSFHHCRTIHGSGPNRSGAPRRSLAIHLQTAGNAFRDGADEATHRNCQIAPRTDAGQPDFTDPTLFPRLWPAG